MAEQEPNARTAGPPPEGSLRGSTLGGMIWTFSGAGFQAILRLVLVLVLARMLGPEVFGIVGAALVVIHISLVFSNLGISAALVQRPVLGPGHVQTAFGFALASGALVSFALQLLTPTIVAFFEFVGGPGSGRWIGHDKRTTVEECLVLSIAPLFSQRLVVPGAWTSGSL